jgi:hypothetical protein
MKRPLLFVFLLLFVTACLPLDARAASSDDDIREVVFRYQFTPWIKSYREHGPASLEQKVFFISVAADGSDPIFAERLGPDGRPIVSPSADPSTELLRRFAHHKPSVKARSHARKDMEGTKDKETGRAGVIFYAGKITRVSDAEVQVEGGHYEHGLSASSATYHLRKKNNKWVVVKITTHMVS